jgi:hypothetical protein
MLARIILCELLLFVALFVVDTATRPAAEAGETAVVRGVVYWDRDADGEQDGDEPGIETNPVLTGEDTSLPLETGFADEDGRYEMEIAPGTYRFSPGVAVAFEQCAGVPLPSYNPFGFRDCVGADYPITSERFTDAFDLAAGETVEIDFGVTTRDEMILLGRALTDEGNAPAGSVVTAVHDGVECGTATIEEGGSPGGGPGDFVLRALGADQREGCFEQGDGVVFVIDGMEANEQWTYTRFSPVPSLNGEYGREGVTTVDVSFLEQHAWIWWDDRWSVSGSPFPPGTPVRAVFPGDIVCGETVTGDIASASEELSGFGRLLVRSADLQAGCGTFGAAFDIIIGDAFFTDGAYWDSVVYQLGDGVPPIDDADSPPPYQYCPPIVTDPASSPDSPPSGTSPDPWPPDSPPFNASPDPWPQSPPPLSPPTSAAVTAFQDVVPVSPPPGELPLSPPPLSPPPADEALSPTVSPPVCYAPAAGVINPPDTGTAGLKGH